MASGYYQLEVAEEDRDKTAFVTKYGQFSFSRMPFGLCKAPATFSRSVSLVLRGPSSKSGIAFLDDMVVFDRDLDSHMVNLSGVLWRFEQYGMKFKPKKWQLLQNSVVFLGRLRGASPSWGDYSNWQLGCTIVQATCSVFYWGPKFPYGSYSKVCIGDKALI